MEATVEPSNATNQNVTWSSSNPEIATVDETTGLVTGIALGTATIIATSVDGGKTATTRVEVVETLSDYYWYVGFDNPNEISNIQTDKTKPGWHNIGTTLSSFVLDTNSKSNWIVITSSTNEADAKRYYVVIPNGLKIYNGLGISMLDDGTNEFTEVTSNISGYNAYQYNYEVTKAKGIVIK